ncbi:cytidine deaminase [Paenibacillus sp. CMAA1364]
MNSVELLAEALKAREKAYIPYSHFGVGAALLDSKGQVHYGCNVENAAYGPTNCAERTAMFRAIADGHQVGSFKALAVIGDTEDPIAPCGVCRQVMVELCDPHMKVILGNLKGDVLETTVSELLPGYFGPSDLKNSKD